MSLTESPLLLEAGRLLPDVLQEKYGDLAHGGWAPRLRARFGYATPDDCYESTVAAIVDAQTTWLDVGCGRDIFPTNPRVAAKLASRCKRLVGVDPSDNLDDNVFVHEKAKLPIEQYVTEHRFDLITLRMVAEHVVDPDGVVAHLAGLLAPGGRVVVYTVSRWSPSATVATVTPMRVHHFIKHLLWETREADTFPTHFRMNTRATLKQLFATAGLQEEAFRLLADCRSTGRFHLLQQVELMVWKGLDRLNLRYPENCILGVYRAPFGAP